MEEEPPLVQAKPEPQTPLVPDNSNISPVSEQPKEEITEEEDDLEIPAFIRKKMKEKGDQKNN